MMKSKMIKTMRVILKMLKELELERVKEWKIKAKK